MHAGRWWREEPPGALEKSIDVFGMLIATMQRMLCTCSVPCEQVPVHSLPMSAALTEAVDRHGRIARCVRTPSDPIPSLPSSTPQAARDRPRRRRNGAAPAPFCPVSLWIQDAPGGPVRRGLPWTTPDGRRGAIGPRPAGGTAFDAVCVVRDTPHRRRPPRRAQTNRRSFYRAPW